jgi:hypothetical protein
MNERRRPPADISPQDLFTRWLPAELQRLGGASGLPDMRVRFELEGPGGGSWDLQLRGGQLSAGPPDPGVPPLLTLRLSVQDWRALAVGEEGPVSLTPPSASPTDLLFIDSSSQQLLANKTGAFALEVTALNGRTRRLLAPGWVDAMYAGELPENPAAILAPAREGARAWLDADYSVMAFAPARLSLKPGEGPPHIRLDRAAEFLIGDRL